MSGTNDTASALWQELADAFESRVKPARLTRPESRIDRPYEVQNIQEVFEPREWWNLDCATLNENGSMLAYLTPEAFCYYLPAFLLCAMDYLNCHNPDVLLLWLSEDVVYASDFTAEVVSLLDTRQRAVVCAVFDYIGRVYAEEEPPKASKLLG